MTTQRAIPETGQQHEVVRLHPIDWNATVEFIKELQRTLATRTLIINVAFSMPQNVLVDTMIQWVRHYMVACHFNHYQRLGYNLGAYSPSKGRAMLLEEVPEVFVHIARHLARPRVLIDGSVSLPIPTAPLCNGNRYGGLPRVADATIVRNAVPAGPPVPVLAAIQIEGTPILYRPRVYPALRRDFSGCKMLRLTAPEGLTPARMCYWANHLGQFVHFLELTDEFDKAIYDIDIVLVPLIIDIPAAVALPAPPAANAPDMNAAAQLVFYNAIVGHYNSQAPIAIQWMALDHLTGAQGVMQRSVFLERESSAYTVSPTRTNAFSRAEYLSKIGSDLESFNFPSLGVTEEIRDLRILANDLGTGHPTSRGKNHRRDRSRSDKRENRQTNAAIRVISGKFDTTDQRDDGAAADERKTSQADASDADAVNEKPAHQRVRRKKRS